MAARSCSKANILFTLMVDRFSVALITRRGYAVNSNVVMAKKKMIIGEGNTNTTSSWVPDPITGYYRPENRAGQVDVAELREILLRNRAVGSN